MNDLSFLDAQAEGLNLSDPEDRAIFRIRVTHRLRITKLSAIDKMVGMHSRSRRTGIHRLCEIYIRQAIA
jgi:hypothetical protein